MATEIKNLKKGDTVILRAFTGMALGKKEVVAADAKTVTIKTSNGTAKFSKKTGVQIEPAAKSERFANYITEDDGSYEKELKERAAKKAKKAESKPAKKSTKAKPEPEDVEEDDEDDEAEEEPTPKKSKKPAAKKSAKKSEPEPEEDDDENDEDDDEDYEEVE